MATYPGPLCEAAGVQIADLLVVSDLYNPFDKKPIPNLSNGIVLELVSLKTEKKLTWSDVLRWISSLTGEDLSGVTVNWLTSKVNRLKTKRTELLKAKKDKSTSSRDERISALLKEPFAIIKSDSESTSREGQRVKHGESTSSTSSVVSSFDRDCLADVCEELQKNPG